MMGSTERVKPSNLKNEEKKREIPKNPAFLTDSPEMEKLLQKVDKFAMSQAPVLITGESGVGKEVIARRIHKQSQRSSDPFVPINSGAIPGELIESELFGHEKGAFTGATSTKEGCFEQAHNGTLFLDEIGDMPNSLQVKVLRAVELNSFRRVGGKHEISVDVRIVSATNKILMEKVEDKSFREDLYHRINVLELYIPPLRRRVDDIPLLLNHFLKEFKEKYGYPEVQFTDECIEVLKNYMWPGNVRELKNIVERCVILSPSEEIDPSILPDRFFKNTDSLKEKDDDMFLQVPMGSTLQEVERAVILQTLAKVNNNKTEAARILGLTRKTLSSKI
ncbi:sigma-54 dependent transcriptional regulator [Aliifodinibius sp. S!AR15-10]|uniref:sigma-54 interaction domain-containing protein n=1 Tax=Aliifodinibius sp. S!AR15-10 TaxID=2950437 RepID=UPI00285E0D50|nr:sigma-54 dependent transcriptional regulator [Aliifodinibius sp. S!AR15-10]MDR8390221.1 sigma-54 dependent transcriptional regulator [Aliifodinibius sp. S!AR15-10]